MTRREIAQLAVKILALWLFGEAIVGLSTVVSFIMALIRSPLDQGFGLQEVLSTGSAAIPTVFYFLAGLFFWSRAETLAARMVSDDRAPVTGIGIDESGAMSVALTAIGVFILVPTLQGVARHLYFIWTGPYTVMEWLQSPEWQSSFWSSLFALVLALWLMLGSRGIVRAILWLRSAGRANRRKPAEPNARTGGDTNS